MARRPRWHAERVKDGVKKVDLLSWRYFYDFVHTEMVEYCFVYRGQRSADWKLQSSLDRLAVRTGNHNREEHLNLFKRAILGRRGPNPPRLPDDDDSPWWALGQHYGLATPLLDWSVSPFVAAYFAFVEPSDPDDVGTRRVVWALAEDGVTNTSSEIRNGFSGTGRPPVVDFIRPYTDENPRLLNQGGLFTRSPDNVDLEQWVRSNFDGSSKWILVKITIPDADRDMCLRELNSMNINHLTLFPDLYGAGKYCNLAYGLVNYYT